MTIDDAIHDFATASNALPRDAMQWSLANWDVAGPRFTALVEGYASGADTAEQTERALFFVLHLLAERRETAAFVPLCRILADAETADLVLGEGLTQTLCGLLISLFDGDAAPLQALVEMAAADDFVREGALLALAYLTRTGRWPGEAMRAYLRRLRQELPQESHTVWLGWVLAVAHLGYADLAGEAETLLRTGLVPEGIMGPGDFWRDLRRALDDPADMAGFDHDNVGPFTDAVGELSRWHDEPAPAPVVNPLRGVGRNDPCPCGSGRKYKKCCLSG